MDVFTLCELSPCVKLFLQECAYDTKSSLLLLNEEKIGAIEKHLAQYGKNVIDGLDCCFSNVYQSQERFHLLPGHVTSILAIPDRIRQSDMNKQKRNPKGEFKKLLTSAELKKLLLNRLNHSVSKYGFDHPFEDENITDVRTIILNNDLHAKCIVHCFTCTTVFEIPFKGHWQTSNVLRHVKQFHLLQNCKFNCVLKTTLHSMRSLYYILL